MTSGRAMIHGAFLSGVGTAAAMAATLALGKLLAEFVPKHEVAVYALLILGSDLLLILCTFGLHTALPKLISAAPESDRPRIITSTLLSQALVSLFFGLLLLAGWWFIQNPVALSAHPSWIDLFPYLYFVPLLSFFATQRDSALGAAAGLSRFGQRAFAIASAALLQALLAALFLWWMGLGLKALIWATLLSYVLGMAIILFALPLPRRADFAWRHYREAVRFSWPLHWNNLLAFATQRLDSLLLLWLLEPAIAAAVVATYELAKRVPGAISRLLAAALVPYLPGVSARIAQGDLEGAARLLRRTLALVAFLGYGGVLTLLAVEQSLIRLLFSEEYLSMTAVLWALLAGICLAIQTGIVGQSIVALGRPGAMTLLNVGTVAVSLTANCILIPRFGMAGAGWAYLLAITQTLYLMRLGLKAPLGSLMLPQCFLVAALALRWWWDGGLYAGLAALALFIALCLASGVVRPKEFRELARALLPNQRPQH